jgi:hypothetical protein
VNFLSAQGISDPEYGDDGTGWAITIFSDENCGGDSKYVATIQLNSECPNILREISEPSYWKSFKAEYVG